MKSFTGLHQRIRALLRSVIPGLLVILIGGVLAGGCGISESVDDLVNKPIGADPTKEYENLSDYYEKFFSMVSSRGMARKGTTTVAALDALPKDPNGEVQWTTAVVEGLIDPRASLDPDYIEEPPLNLNIFIEAKSPLFANVLFPHSIHTYWLNCSTCHPNIFLPEAGANPITMDEIFQGKWCGRCHGKVAFTFWPRANCTRCHIIPKGASRQHEHWR